VDWGWSNMSVVAVAPVTWASRASSEPKNGGSPRRATITARWSARGETTAWWASTPGIQSGFERYAVEHVEGTESS
jgi:hypothetical protein